MNLALRDWALTEVAERATPEPNSGCWLWEGAAYQTGYGYANFNGTRYTMSRAVLGLEPSRQGSPNNALMACHRCDTPACVNPAHLYAGTRSDNMRDCYRRGRQANVAKRDLKTLCIRGHLIGDNPYVLKNGKRFCRRCKVMAAAARDYSKAKRAA